MSIQVNKIIKELAIVNYGYVSSSCQIENIYKFCLDYPFQYVPVCDDGQLTGVINRKELISQSYKTIKDKFVRNFKEDVPYTALNTSHPLSLLKQMSILKTNAVIIIDEWSNYIGIFDLLKAKKFVHHVHNIAPNF